MRARIAGLSGPESVSNGDGLLVDGGVSRGNIVSGDASRVMTTASMGTDPSRHHISDYYALFINPYNVSRLMTLAIADFMREKRQYRAARKNHVEPILGKDHRGGTYPLIRVFNTTIMPEINVDTLVGDLLAGVPVAYSTFVAYDEVAHHSGIESPDAYDQLTRLDQRFARVANAVKDAPRPYHLVVLSDHGQTNGATFKQRYGLSLGDLVQQLAVEHEVTSIDEVAEGGSNLNFFLTDVVNNDDGTVSKTMGRILGGHTQDGQVILGSKGKAQEHPEQTPNKSDDTQKPQISVLASGNLGLVYATDWEQRVTMEQLEKVVPGLIDGLAQHEGIGFVLVHSEEHGAVVVGAKGRCYLDEDNRVEGEDPLSPFGPNAADHLRRNDGFPNAPDIYVNSFYDPEANEGCAFEELIGFHGGLGGTQTQPFVLHPVELKVEGSLVGAASVYKLGKSWIHQLQGGEST